MKPRLLHTWKPSDAAIQTCKNGCPWTRHSELVYGLEGQARLVRQYRGPGGVTLDLAPPCEGTWRSKIAVPKCHHPMLGSDA